MKDKYTFEEMQALITEQVDNEDCPKNNPLYLDGWEGGLIGWQRDEEGNVHAVYSEEKMLEYWCKENKCEHIEAVEFYEYNTLRSLPYCEKENVPYIVHTFD